jgi:hypothetical protein
MSGKTRTSKEGEPGLFRIRDPLEWREGKFVRAFCEELIVKVAERFVGTIAEATWYYYNVCEDRRWSDIFDRMACATAIAQDKSLRAKGYLPILLQDFLTDKRILAYGKQMELPFGALPSEPLGLILYPTKPSLKCKETNLFSDYLWKEIKDKRKTLGLDNEEVNSSQPLLIMNMGLKRDYGSGSFNVRPIVLEGITRVVSHPTLSLPSKGVFEPDSYNFGFGVGIENHLPAPHSFEEIHKAYCELQVPKMEERLGIKTIGSIANTGLNTVGANPSLSGGRWRGDLIIGSPYGGGITFKEYKF